MQAGRYGTTKSVKGADYCVEDGDGVASAAWLVRMRCRPGARPIAWASSAALASGRESWRHWIQRPSAARSEVVTVVFRIILHDDFRIISDANLVIIQIVSCRRELGARGLTEAAGSGKFPSGGTDDSDLFCFAADLQLNRGLDGSAVGWQGVVRSGTVFCRSRLRGLAGPVGSGVGIAVAGRSSL